MQKLKKPVSILLVFMMIVSLFTIVPITASAAIGDVLSVDDYLTFTAEEAGSTVTLNVASGSNLQYKNNNSDWASYTPGTPITLNNVGDYVRFSGKDTGFNDHNHVSLTGKVACSGNVMSLRLNGGKSQGLSNSCFQYMFDYCDGLTTAPELPETTLATSCYFSMFRGCTSLTKAPVLPAKTLAKNCYRYMFRECTSLTELPALPATTLADYCYAYMFYDCSNIRISDVAGTFDGITYSAEYRIPSTGTGTPAEDALDGMFGGTGGKFTETPSINTTYYLPAPPTYTVTWKNEDGSLINTTTVAAGETPTHAAPTKDAGECCTYTFHGWDDTLHTYTGALPAVNEDTTFTAVFTDTPKDDYYKTTTGGHSVYSIVPLGNNVADGETKPEFFTESGTEYFRLTSRKNCKYNYYSANGANLGASFTKSFDGDNYVVVTSNPMPKIVLVKPVYTINWNNWDDTQLSIIGTDVIHGETPAYDGENPTRADDDANTYTFTGWEPALAPATDNATYTAKFNETPKAFVASVTTSNGTTTKYTDFGTAVSNWTDGSTLTLLADVTTSSTINVYDGTKTFDLNGYGIRRDGTDRLFNIAYSRTLTMNDSNPDRVHYITLSNYSGVSVSDTGTEAEVVNGNGVVKVNGGYLTGAAFSYGGCICLDNGCHFIMNAGTIIGNTSSNSGAVRMNKGGTFTMNGGQIIYNLGPVGAVNREDNGSSVFEVSGASVIKNNYNSSGNSRNVFVNAGSINKVTGSLKDGAEIGVNMTSGTGVFTNTDSDKINYNDPTKFFSDNSAYGVFKNDAGQLELKPACTVTWKNGNTVLKTEKVAKGTIPQYTGETPTKTDDAQHTYTFTGWTPALAPVNDDTTYTATFEPCVASVTTAGGTTTKYTDFGQAVSNWTDGSTLKLLADVTMNGTITISGTRTLDLNGYGITKSDQGRLFNVDGNLTINDSNPTRSTHKYTVDGTGLAVLDENGTQSFQGGYITGGYGYADSGATGWGGFALVDMDRKGNCSLTINGGTIIGNKTEIGGGGVVRLNGNSTFTMNGGAIIYNTTAYLTQSQVNDGAVSGEENVTFYIGGGTIAHNTTKGGVTSDLYLANNQKVIVDGELDSATSIGIKMQNGTGVFTDSAETANNDASKFKSDDASYTVGKNADGQLYLYKSLIAGHSLSLDGNIGINFYLDPSVAGLTAQQVTDDNLSYTFAWADVETTKAKVNVAEQAKQKKYSVETINGVDYIKVTCYVCAAEMTCDVIASFTLGDKTESKTYSVRKYCDTVIKATPAQIDGLFGGTEKYNKLVELVKAMLNYGAMAQTKFGINTGTPGSSDTPATPGKLANEGVTYNPGDVTTAKLDTAIAEANGTGIVADNMNNVAAALGAKWYSTSLIYLDDSTLRHYFVKATDAFKPSDYTGKKSNYYYYVEVTGIPAAELDKLQSFTAGTKTFKYSALDFVKGMINSSADGDSKNLAKALYWYNQAANDYFPAPAEKILVLDDVTEDTTVEDGYTITGTLKGDYKISIADGATVTLRGVDITCLTDGAEYAGITLAGDATLNLEGANTVKGGYKDYAGVYVPEGKTLTIDGTGSLDASSNGNGCGIGAGWNGKPAGNIVINGGTITAIGGDTSAGIGGSHKSNCGDITITGGTVYAESLGRASGIGAGHGFYGSRCGNITISGGSVTAIGESFGSGIGTGLMGECGAILITAGVTQVTATKGENAPNSIGAGDEGSCGTISIAAGANVIEN